MITLEVDPRHADVARANITRAGVAESVDIRVGPAIDTLPTLHKEGEGPFDLVFIDADKPSTPDYFTWAVRLSRPGALIVIDNVVRRGALVDAKSGDPNVEGMRRLNELIARETGVTATLIQTVGAKGYDGFLMALVGESR